MRLRTLQWRVILVTVALVSFAMLLLFCSLATLYADPNEWLISKAMDSLVFQVGTQASTAILTASTVGVIIDAARGKASAAQDRIASLLEAEGIVALYANYNDPAFQADLIERIRAAKSEICFVGLGHGVLANNLSVVDVIRDAVTKRKIQIRIAFGSNQNSGVISRVDEEESAHREAGLSYDRSWLTRFPEEIRTHLLKSLPDAAATRVAVGFLQFTPMMQYIRVDDAIFVAPYGSPTQRGSASPILRVDCEAGGRMAKFLEAYEAAALESL